MRFATLTTRCSTCRGRGILSAFGGDVKLCPRCGGSGQMPIKVRRVPFDYTFAIVTLSNSGNVLSQPLQLDDDSPYEQIGWMLRLSPGLSPATPSVQIVDQSNGWQFSNSPIFVQNFSCTGTASGFIGGGLMFPLLVPYIWMPTAQAQLKVTDVTAGGSNQLQVGMKGYKLFAPDGSQLNLYPEQQQAAA